MDKKKTFKQDINLLEYPIWFQDTKFDPEKKFIWKHKGYEYNAKHNLPTRTDAIFLYCLLMESENDNWNEYLEITRFKLLNMSGLKKNSKAYLRIEESLKRWRFTEVSFKGVFYDNIRYETLNFGIIDYWGINSKNKKLIIKLNEKFILKIKNSNYYKRIPINDLKKLRSATSARLYELLFKSFQSRQIYKIESTKLAKKIPLTQEYPSQIVRAVIPAVKRIRSKTSLNVHLEIDSQGRGKKILIFKLGSNKTKKLLENNKKFPEETLKLILEVPEQYRYYDTVQNMIIKSYNEKGLAYVKKSIEYTNRMETDDYSSYLFSVLKHNYAKKRNHEVKKYGNHINKARRCYNGKGNYGSCSATWERYKNTKESDCYWCEKFKVYRVG